MPRYSKNAHSLPHVAPRTQVTYMTPPQIDVAVSHSSGHYEKAALWDHSTLFEAAQDALGESGSRPLKRQN